MKIVRNKLIPFPGYKAINLFGVLFVRGNAMIDDVTINHERIHTSQIKELLYIFFYVWYGVEWLIRLVQYWRVGYTAYKDSGLKEALRKLNYMAYRNLSFEREAYQNEGYLSYLDHRKRFNFLKYVI